MYDSANLDIDVSTLGDISLKTNQGGDVIFKKGDFRRDESHRRCGRGSMIPRYSHFLVIDGSHF